MLHIMRGHFATPKQYSAQSFDCLVMVLLNKIYEQDAVNRLSNFVSVRLYAPGYAPGGLTPPQHEIVC